MSQVDQSLSNGMNDFFFVQLDETDLAFNYFGFTDADGVVLLMRMPKDSNTALYWVGTGEFATIWAARETKSYKYPFQLKAPRV